MQKNLYCKILAIGILFILICIMIIPISLGYNVKTSPYANESEITEIHDKEIDWWPVIHHDIQHTGFSTSHAYNYLSPKWTFSGTDCFHSPTISQNRLYIGSNDDKVYCLNINSGEEIWSYKTGHNVVTSPAVYNDRIYFGSIDNKVYCLDALNGEFIWSYKTMGPVCSSPIVYDGKVFIGSDDHYIYCLDAIDGRRIWYYGNWNRIKGSPAIFNNYVFIGVLDGNLVCLNINNGQIVWSIQSGGVKIWGSPVIYDGNVFFGTSAYSMWCLNATNGAWIWRKNIGREILNSPAIAYDKVYVVCYNDWRLFCLNASNGKEIWRFKAGDVISGSPIVADGKVYFTSNEHLLYCLNCSSGEVLWTYYIGGSIIYGSPVIVKGFIYLGTLSSKIHAFRTKEFNNPPDPPSITGPKSGKQEIKYDFVISSSDLDGNPISYFVDWGDGTNSGWIGEYSSGQEITLSHNWSSGGRYIFKVKAKDAFGFESDCIEFEIKISRDVYENTNCFVIGSVSDSWNLVPDDGSICSGWRNENHANDKFPSSGWIYTDGDKGKWLYHSLLKGKFNGQLGSITYVHWYTEDDITHYIAIKDFRGLALGAWGFFFPGTEPSSKGHCRFIGYAEHVKIRTA